MMGDSAKARCGASLTAAGLASVIRYRALNARGVSGWRFGMRVLPFAWAGNGRFFWFWYPVVSVGFTAAL